MSGEEQDQRRKKRRTVPCPNIKERGGDNETRLEADREDGMSPSTGKMKKQRKASKAAGQYVAGCSCTNISASAPS